MLDKMNLLGAIVAHVIYASSIVTFLARLFWRVPPGHWVGIPLLLMAFPLGYLLVVAPQLRRPALYYIQVGLMLLWIVAAFVLDYVLKVDFRDTRWAVISYVVFFFAALGGMIGVSALAGRAWTLSAVVLFFVTLALAFVQRAVTGY